MKRWISGLVAAVVVVLAVPAIAAPPAAGTPEDTIVQTLKLLKDGKLDEFISTYCDPNYCNTGNLESLKAYALKHAAEHAKDCLREGDTLEVTRVKGDFTKDSRATIYVRCEPDRMPVPTNFTKQPDGSWKISGLSF